MVSGVAESSPAKYKSNKKGFFSSAPNQAPPPPPQATQAQAPLHMPNGNKRFSDGDLRPWPPMYTGRSPTDDQTNNQTNGANNNNNTNNFRSLSTNKLNGSTTNNNYIHNGHSNKSANNNNSNTTNSSNYAHPVYQRNKYNFHMGNGNKSVSSMNSLAAPASMKSGHGGSKGGHGGGGNQQAQDYYMLSQPYVMNSLAVAPPSEGSVYASRDSNLLMVAKDREKNRFRKLRNPTQLVNATAATTGSVASGNGTTRSSCPCVRSKSMEDVRSDVVVDWPTYIKDNFKNLNNGRELQQPSSNGGASTAASTLMTTATKHSNTRRSMDNLLKVDTHFGGRPFQVHSQNDPNRPRFVAVTALEDVQAVRCAEFHPNGKVYSVGSNSKTFRICEYPSLSDIREEHTTFQPTVLFKRTKHHKGSIYCMAWSPQGDLVATGSNDKTVKLMRYNEQQQQLEGKEIELTMHDGTVRDLCFLEDSTNKTSLLISGGAGDCKVYVTDCATSTPFQALSGHGGHILSLYNWGGAMFVSGSQDKTVRFWDLRTRGCVNTVTPATVPGSRQGSPVAAVCVDPSGRLLVSGHEDSSCVLYDIRGNRPIQCFKPHSTDVRSIRFSPSAYYLLTGGYDNKLVLTDLQGDLTMPLPSVVVAQHSDKVISGRWHPTDFSFLSTSADKTATLWALPPI